MNLLSVSNIHKVFKESKVLKEIFLSIEKGKFYVLLGHNGAGKSTLLKILAGIEYQDIGEIESHFDPNLGHSTLAYVSENTGYDLGVNIRTLVKIHSELYSGFKALRLIRSLDSRGISIDQKFSDLSRGQKMQVAFSFAVCRNPTILLLDEITSVLDIKAQKDFMFLLEDYIKEGGTVVCTTNIITEFQSCADHLFILKKGRMLLNTDIKFINEIFVKLRKTERNKSHYLFESENLCWVGRNLDNSDSYLILKTDLENDDYTELLDKRAITLEEVYLFFSEHDEEVLAA